MRPGLILRSPLLHFILLGLAGYMIFRLLAPEQKETIIITPQALESLIRQEQSIVPGPVSEERKQEIVENYIEDEILIREAYKRGLNKNDYRVRRRILYIMRNSLSEVIPEPSDAQLRAYYDEDPDRYALDSSRSFEHVFFYPGSLIPEDTEAFIRDIESSTDYTRLGDDTPTGNRMNRTSYRQIAAQFGKDFTDEVFRIPVNLWTGPLQSIMGTHFVRVTEILQPRAPVFEEVEPYLRQDYLLEKSIGSQRDKINELSKNYKVIINREEPK